MQSTCRALNWTYQPAVYAAQDDESKESLIQEMRRRKGNVGTHSVYVPCIGKVKDADLELCQDGSKTNKRGEAEWGLWPSVRGLNSLVAPYKFK